MLKHLLVAIGLLMYVGTAEARPLAKNLTQLPVLKDSGKFLQKVGQKVGIFAAGAAIVGTAILGVLPQQVDAHGGERQQYMFEQRSHTSYVYVPSRYRSTERQWLYEEDEVYFTQRGGVYSGVVEKRMPGNRVLISGIYGSRVYNDAGQQKRIVPLKDVKGMSLRDHPDIGLEVVLENDHSIFYRDDDDYMERFYATVEEVYNDGYYRLRIDNGTAVGGFWVKLHTPYVVFVHKNIWPMEGHPIEGHRDVGRDVLILGEEGSNIEYLLGRVEQVMDDGFYDIEIRAKRDFQGNRIKLAKKYRVFVHEDTPARQGGMVKTWLDELDE